MAHTCIGFDDRSHADTAVSPQYGTIAKIPDRFMGDHQRATRKSCSDGSVLDAQVVRLISLYHLVQSPRHPLTFQYFNMR